jgi:hypothetical protein
VAKVAGDLIAAAKELLIAGASARSVAVQLGLPRERVRKLSHDPDVVGAIEARDREKREATRRIQRQIGLPSAARERRTQPPVPAAGSMIARALAIPPRAGSEPWGDLGEAFTLEGMLPGQSRVLFERAADGIPIPLAAVRAGCAEGDPAVWESRANMGEEPFLSYYRALLMASIAAVEELTFRVADGGMGWQGAAKLLGALRPDIYAVKDRTGGEQANSIEGLDDAQLIEIAREQLIEIDGIEVPRVSGEKKIVPLHDTGMDDEVTDAGRR